MQREEKNKKFNHEKQKHKFKLVHYKLGKQGNVKNLGAIVGNFLGFNIL